MANSPLDLARRYVEYTGVSLFLTGKAGTGKTTFLHDIDAHCPKRHVVVAPTGVAAVNAGGVTIHSFFQLPPDPYLPDVKELVTEYQMPNRHASIGRNKLNIMRTLELLVIDEISMVRADLLDAIDMTLRRVRRSGRPFGGVQLLMIGDVHQLPPVVNERERPYMEQVYPSPFFFHSKALQRLHYVTIELTTVFRQQDATFVDLLNHVRNNRLDAATLSALNSRVGTPHPEAIILTTHNYQADAINRNKMDALQGESRTFEAKVRGNFPESMYPVEREMVVKVGERVMFIKNDSSGDRRYYNGKLATVSGFAEADEGRVVVEVIDDDGHPVDVGYEVWENVKYTLQAGSGEIVQSVEGTFLQYPLRPAWAVTIHKAQGLTFDRVAINAAEAFAFGQVYVALSRCRTLEGLTLTTPIGASVAFSDADVEHFCNSQPAFEQVLDAVYNAEMQYRYEQLADLFGCGAMLRDVERVAEIYARIRTVYPKQYDALLSIGRQLADMASVGERFCAQLFRIVSVSQENDDLVADRVAKGAPYYIEKLSPIEPSLSALFDVEIDNKETARQLKEAGVVLQERLGGKLYCLKTIEKQGYSMTTLQKAKVSYQLNRRAVSSSGQHEPSKTSVKNSSSLPNSVVEHDSDTLLALISKWRREKAAEQHVAPFMILHQKVAVAIAKQLPQSMRQLLAVSGVGRVKAERYGEDLLAIVADFCASQGIDK